MMSDDERYRLTKTFVWAGVLIVLSGIAAITIVVSEGRGSQLGDTVTTVAPFLSAAVVLVVGKQAVSGLVNGQSAIQTQVDTVQQQTNGALSNKLEQVVRYVLADPEIQKQLSANLAEHLILKAGESIVDLSHAGRPS